MKSAVIGLGVIGRVHATVLKDEGYNLCAVCDTDAEKLASYAVPGYTDYLQMLEQEKPDVVHICTPHYLHTEMILEALHRNINVLCEKPLCIKMEDIPRILEAERASNAILGVCQQNRYNPTNVFIKNYLTDKTVHDAYGTVIWKRDAAYYASGAWRGKKSTEGGGVLINQALHTLDILQWLSGMPKTVIATVSNMTLPQIEVEDTAALLFTGGAEFSLFATLGSNNDFPVSVTLHADNETIQILPQTILINGKAVEFPQENRINGKLCYGSGHNALFADFYECVANGSHFSIDGKEASKVVRLILSAYESNGKPVQI